VTITGHRYETYYNRAGAVTHELFGENVRALDPPDHHCCCSKEACVARISTSR
jgi:hypothetical protein